MTRQIVLMTGCSMGIGLAIATRLAHDPDHRFVVIATVIAMSEKADLEAAVGDTLNQSVFIKELDITNDDSITEVVADVIANHERIDILLNIAGMAITGIPERITRKQMDKMFSVNVTGTFRLTQAVLPHMKQREAGKVVTFSSAAGRVGSPYMDLYCASKFAVEGFFESLAASVRAFNIRICLVEPIAVNTGLWDTIKSGVEAYSKDDTVHEIDKRQLSTLLGVYNSWPSLTTDDIVEAVMTQCLNVDDPVLRHMLGDIAKLTYSQGAADLTGEATVALSRKSLGY